MAVASAPKIVLRTRPSSDRFPTEALRIDQASKTVTVTLGGRNGLPSDRSGGAQSYSFKFDAVLHSVPQTAVYEECGADVVQGALEGYNGTILCYGQTGAGKTYTMTGDRAAYAERGLIPRVVSALMAALRAEQGLASWQLRVSYLEIYNEAIFDLLDITTQPHEITLYEDGAGRLAISGLRAADVRSEQEALALFFEGEANRVIGEHQLNRESSRSHCVFTLALALVREGDEGRAVRASIHLVDLAGSERVSKTRSEGLLLREAGHINKSLHILEQARTWLLAVVLAAGERGRDHVPFRSSKLTHVLRDSIGGNCRTVLVANVWGDAAQLEETLSTCRFAARMARLTCEVSRNVVAADGGGGARVRQLEREMAELLEELAMRDLWDGRGSGGTGGDGEDGSGEGPGGSRAEGAGVASSSGATPPMLAAARARYIPYSRARRDALRTQVQQFLLADGGGDGGGGGEAGSSGAGFPLAPLGIDSARRLREVLRACQELYQEALSRHSGEPAAAATASTVGPSLGAQQRPAGGQAVGGSAAWEEQQAQAAGASEGGAWRGYVGEEEARGASQSGGAGIAPDDARPGAGAPGAAPRAGAAPAPAAEAATPPPPPPPLARGSEDAAEALERFRAGPGADKARLLGENAAKARAARRAARDLALQLNGLKRGIDEAKAAAEAARAARLERGGEEAQVASPSELEALQSLRDVKAAYRDAWGDHQLARSEAEYAAGLAEACRRELLAEFEAWRRGERGGAAGGPPPSGGGGGAAGEAPPQLPPAAAAAVAAWRIGAECGPGGSGASSPASRAGSAASLGGASLLLGGLPSPGCASLAGSLAPTPQQPRTPQSGRGGGGVPLASIVVAAAAEAEARGDAGAAAYFGAQSAAAWRAPGGQRPGSVKKHRAERGTFSVTQRSAITDTAPR
ncbi:kinesin [Raphidocelis subcapitata]|uniref:Kinesin-like protein n=1 Tax=Raphidocelis subcapitata TaxID=307507 RepID=A0A2V0P1H0_9CHLO|nr:kinesin [Raphidocelis subcapitata]|eukprot:GBF93731.1 kinesin [Raphidocelis subcapitata]